MRPSRTPAQSAAQASWVAPVFVCVVNILGSGSAEHAAEIGMAQYMAWMRAGITLVLLGLGLGCAVAALVTMRRYGKDGVLVPAIIGLALNLGMLGMFVLGVLIALRVHLMA